MKLICITILCALALSACSKGSDGVRLTRDVVKENPSVPKTAAPKVSARTEPVFFNGKIYQVSLVPMGAGKAQIKISGMNGAQAKGAAELAKSSFHHFSCREKQRASLSIPQFENGAWLAIGHCI